MKLRPSPHRLFPLSQIVAELFGVHSASSQHWPLAGKARARRGTVTTKAYVQYSYDREKREAFSLCIRKIKAAFCWSVNMHIYALIKE